MTARHCLALVGLTMLLARNADASHGAGMDLTYTCVSGNTYEFTLTFYRDCGGIAVTTPSLDVSGCGTGFISTTLQSVTEITPLCPTAQSNCSGGSITGYEQYVYTGTYTFPSGCNDWVVSYGQCCRNNIITNLQTPQNFDLYVETHINNLNGQCNSSPTFSNPPVTFLCNGQFTCIDPGGTDPEGDSLVFSLVNPLHDGTSPIAFTAGNTVTSPLATSSGVNINPTTGSVCFTPNGVQVAVLAIEVSQYDPVTGQFLGSVIRDIQVTILACSNQPPQPEGFDNLGWSQGVNDQVEVCTGQPVQYTINSSDPDMDPITISSSNIPAGATWTDLGNGTWSIDWTPGANDIGCHSFTVNYTDDECPYPSSFAATYTICVTPGTVAGPDQTICGDMTAQLQASSGNVFTWSVISGDPIQVGSNFSCNPCANPEASPSVTTTYMVTSDLSGTCGNQDTVTVNVVPNLGNLHVSAESDTAICDGQCVDLTGTAYMVQDPADPMPTFYGAVNQNVADSNPVNHGINVSGLNLGTIGPGDIESICLDIDHGADEELEIYVTCPSGLQFELSTGNGGTNDNYDNTCFTVTAVTPISSGTPPFTGDFIPEGGSLTTAFSGCPANGTWTLNVVDNRGDYNCFLFVCDNDDGVVNDWSITFNDQSDTLPLTTSWSPTTNMTGAGTLTPNVCPTTTTDYVLTGSDPNNCTLTDTVTVSVSSAFTVSETITPDTCGSGVGTIDLLVSGNTGPLGYSWSPGGQTTEDINGLTAGTYDVVITDQGSAGCSATFQYSVTDISLVPTIDTILITDESCPNALDGMAELVFSGGSGSFQLDVTGQMNIPNASNPMTNLEPGSYDVLITDLGSGCTTTSSFVVGSKNIVTLSQTTTIAGCGVSDGSLEVDNAPVGSSFSLDNVNFGPDSLFQGLAAGTYTAFVQYYGICLDSVTATINNTPSHVIDAVNTTAETCPGLCDGTAEIFISGGSNPMLYSLDNGNTTQPSSLFTSLCPGTHNVWVQDANSCVVQGTFDISSPSPLSFSWDSTGVSCNGGDDGEIEFLSPSGGTAPYEYEISGPQNMGPQSNPEFEYLESGLYQLTLHDAVGCSESANTQITEPAPLSLNTQTQDVSCYGASDGQAMAHVAGGTTPYQYVWPAGVNVSNDSIATNLPQGQYSVVVNDANGCTAWDSTLAVNEPAPLAAPDVVVTDEQCSGACDGSLQVNNPQAVAFSFDGGLSFGTLSVVSGLCPGNYEVWIEDASGCQQDTIVSLASVNPVTITGSDDTLICQVGTAILQAQAQGGSGNYTYHWNEVLGGTLPGTGPTHNVAPSQTTLYEVYAEDAQGCTSTPVQIQVQVNPLLDVNAFNSDDLCVGETVAINSTAGGGDGNYTYSWTDDQGNVVSTSPNFTVTPPVTTTYTLTLDDGCETPPVQDAVTISVHPVPTPSISVSDSIGCAPLTVQFDNPTVTQSGISFHWDFGDGNHSSDTLPSHTYSEPGCYDVTLTLTNTIGCNEEQLIQDMVCVDAVPEALFNFSPSQVYMDDTEVVFENLSVNADTYSWDFGDESGIVTEVNPTHDFPGTEPGTYEIWLHAYSDFGCVDSSLGEVVVMEELLFFVPNVFTPDGDSHNELFKPVMVSGYNPSRFTMYIFNRWGETIFESHNPWVGWDGTYTYDALPCPDGVYVWMIELMDNTTDEKKVFQGHVTLLR